MEDPAPRWIANLSKLESLALYFYCETTSPADFALPPRLNSLSLLGPCLRRLPRLPSSLSSLSLYFSNSLRSMEDLSHLKKLSLLYLESVTIAEIQGLGCLENLQEMELRNLLQVERLPDLRNLNKLKSLQVSNCCSLFEIQGELPRFLDRLHISSCPSLQNLPDLSSLMVNQEVKIDFCSKLNVEAILGFAQNNPRDLKLKGLHQLHILPDLSNLNELRHLKVSYCHNLVEIQGELPQSLEELEISSCKSLQKLPILSSLKGRLRRLKINGCEKLNEEAILGFAQRNPLDLQLQILPDLSNSNEPRRPRVENCGNLVKIQGKLPESWEKLDISFCEALHKLPDLSSLMGLREVYISTCGNLVEIQGKLPESLEKLDISFCQSLHKLPDLSNLMRLREVHINTCGSLIELRGELPQSLEELKISFCASLQKLPDLSSLKGLQRFDIEGCMKVKGEAILGSSHRCIVNLWENLQYLRICGLGQLKILPDLSNSNKLRHLQVENCGDLVQIQGELPQSLKELKISSCKSLHKLPDLSSLKGLQMLSIDRCRKLNAEVSSWLCSEKLVTFVVEYHESEFNHAYEPEGEDKE